MMSNFFKANPDTMIHAIILDFDGVILESVTVKTEAFRNLFSFVPEHVDEIVQFHIDNGGMSRFDKFRHIYENILHEPLTQSKFDELSDQFAMIVFDAVLIIPFVPGAQEFLEKYSPQVPLYIVSATPEKELHEIVQKRGLSPYFQKVFGAPRKKSDCIREILESTGNSPESVLFIGDARNDLEAAKASGVRFVGRVKSGDRNHFVGATGVDEIIPDLFSLGQFVEGKI